MAAKLALTRTFCLSKHVFLGSLEEFFWKRVPFFSEGSVFVMTMRIHPT